MCICFLRSRSASVVSAFMLAFTCCHRRSIPSFYWNHQIKLQNTARDPNSNIQFDCLISLFIKYKRALTGTITTIPYSVTINSWCPSCWGNRSTVNKFPQSVSFKVHYVIIEPKCNLRRSYVMDGRDTWANEWSTAVPVTPYLLQEGSRQP